MEPARLTMLGLEVAHHNMSALVEHVGLTGGDDLRSRYFHSLNAVQMNSVPFMEAEPVLAFDLGDPAIRALAMAFSGDEDGSELEAFTPAESDEVRILVAAGLALLKSQDEVIPQLISTLIGCSIFVRKAGIAGGSFPGTLGAIWLNPLTDWDTVEYAVALLHETVHQSLFLHDMVNALYHQPSSEMEYSPKVFSAIRREKRGYDPAFHAAYVALAIRDVYARANREMKVRQLHEGLASSLPELEKHRDVLTDHGAAVLDEMTERFNRLALAVS
jgi:HEXXH motif-containing protein